MFRTIIIFISLSFLLTCTTKPKNVHGPDPDAYIFKSSRFVESVGRVINMDSMASPKYVPAKGRHTGIGLPNYFPARSNYYPEGPQVYKTVPGKDTSSKQYAIPNPLSAEGDMVNAIWPSQVLASARSSEVTQMNFSYLDMKQGLSNNFIRCLMQDRSGKIWIGNWLGGLNVWDGNSLSNFTTKNGLSSNNIRALLEGRDGKVWIGTFEGGLTMWDGSVFQHFSVEQGLSSNKVKCLLEDQKGNIWIGTSNGLNIWDGSGFSCFTTENGLSDNSINAILEDRNGKIWIGTSRGGLSVWNGSGFTHYTTDQGLSSNGVRCLLEDQKGQIWIGGRGLTVWDGSGFRQFTIEDGLSRDIVWSLLEDQNGNICIGTFGGGLNIWDGSGFTHYSTVEGLSHNIVNCLLEDQNGNLYIGTEGGGMSIWHRAGPVHFSAANGLGRNDVWSLLERSDGSICIGTEGGGMSVLDSAGISTYSKAQGLNSNAVFSFLEDRTGNIWIGTYGGGITVWDSTGFTNYTTENGLSDNAVYCLMESRDGRIWIGTLRGGLSVWDGSGFTHFTTAEGLSSNSIWSLMEDRDGNVWIGTNGGGVSVWDGKGFTHFTTREGLSNNDVWCLLEDQDGRVWIGTNGGGLDIWDGTGFTNYTKEEGLSSDNIWGLYQDKWGDIWLGTMHGLNRLVFSPGNAAPMLQVFNTSDGLKGISIKPILLDQQEMLWLGSTAGLARFNLGKFRNTHARPKVALTNLSTFFDKTDWRQVQRNDKEHGKYLTGEEQVSLKKIRFDSVRAFTNLPLKPTFPHHINHLSFSWSGIYWQAPHQLRYSYFLEGKDRFWSPPMRGNTTTYTDLNPGRYTFHLRAVGHGRQWSDQASYTFSIHPPWWLSWWAKTILVLVTLGSLYAFYRYQLKHRMAQLESARLRELDAVKTNFYTNVSHEFRTPLTVILGLAKNTLSDSGRAFAIIHRNAMQLFRLVNQMLDLQKLQSGNTSLQMIRGDIIPYLSYLTESFHSFAASRNVAFQVHYAVEKLDMDYEPKMIQDIVTNLISNAIKFTPEGGEVNFSISSSRSVENRQAADLSASDCLTLTVKDTGQGIPKDKLSFIFDRFYQAHDPSSKEDVGTGIGLALTKELVKLLGGKIFVESKIGAGSTFFVVLPITRDADPVKDLHPQIPIAIAAEKKAFEGSDDNPKEEFSEENSIAKAAPLLLLIEDNKDVLRHIGNQLKETYRLEFAYDGQEGIEKAIELVPDIIISDIMMPLKDGFEVCNTLKQDERTSHIPMILLTAKADIESKIEGLKHGADAYLAKPYNESELKASLENLLEQRRKLQAVYQSETLFDRARYEDVFLRKINEAIESNLADPDYGLEQLCQLATMSHSQLFRKIKALTGRSVVSYIRYYRLQKAHRLLITTQLNIAEIAFETGFNDPNYFTRAFRKEFGENPSSSRSAGQ